jgi:hypothetical protein
MEQKNGTIHQLKKTYLPEVGFNMMRRGDFEFNG